MKMGSIAIVIFVLTCVFMQGVSAQSMIGLYTDDAHSSIAANNIEDPCYFDLWVWIQPGDNGVIAAEYKLDLPENMSPQSFTINPDNSLSMGAPYGSPGFSIVFDECRTDWFWTTKIQILLTDRTPLALIPLPYDGQETMIVMNCLPNYPTESLITLHALSVNNALPPMLTEIEVTGQTSLRAYFDRDLIEDDMYSIEVTTGNISIHETYNPSCIIEILSVQIVDGSESSLEITVASPLDEQTSYTFAAMDICAWGNYGFMSVSPVCGDSEMDFSGTVSTSSSSWGAIKRLMEITLASLDRMEEE
jgi:hypothetical protein